MYNEYDDELDELLEEAYLEGYYDSMDDYDDYYNESRAVGREWLRLNDNVKTAKAGSNDSNLPIRIRKRFGKDVDYWIRKRNNIYNSWYPDDLARGLKGSPHQIDRSVVRDFKDAMGRRTYKDREPGHYLKLQEIKKKYKYK